MGFFPAGELCGAEESAATTPRPAVAVMLCPPKIHMSRVRSPHGRISAPWKSHTEVPRPAVHKRGTLRPRRPPPPARMNLVSLLVYYSAGSVLRLLGNWPPHPLPIFGKHGPFSVYIRPDSPRGMQLHANKELDFFFWPYRSHVYLVGSRKT